MVNNIITPMSVVELPDSIFEQDDFYRLEKIKITPIVETTGITYYNGKLLIMNNKIYDLKSHTFISPNPYDYISLTTGYDYIDNLDEDKKLETELEKLISSILPDEDEKK